MYLVAIAWMYVVLMMALAEALSAQGTVLGALFTLILYGLAPLALVLYLLGTPMRRRARRAQEAEAGSSQVSERAVTQPHSSGHATGGPVAPVGEEAIGEAHRAQPGLGDPSQSR